MNIKTTGIILRSVDYRESSLILDIYTESHGLMGFIVSGVRKKKPRISQSLMQVGNVIELIAFKGSGSLARISEVKLKLLLKNISKEVQRSAVYIFSLEVLKKSIKENENHLSLFNFIMDYIKQLDSEKGHLQMYPSFYLWKLSHHLGVQPNLIEHLPYFDIRAGRSVDSLPLHIDYIETATTHGIFLLQQTKLDSIGSLRCVTQEKIEIFESFLTYFAYHVYGFGELKSVRILKEIFR